jgi:hypothetical protein
MKSNLSTTLLCGLILQVFSFHALAQTDTLYYVNSSFETPEDQAKWTSTPSHATIKWNYETGGHTYPLNAKSGSKNAIFYWSDFGTSYYRNLISQPIDLSGAEKPELTFWHAQAAYIGQDELKILFKAGSSAPWDTIAYYPNEIEDWTQHIFSIDEVDEKYLCENFYIGFLGLANGGQGVCIDSVVLKETSIIDKYIKSVDYYPVNHLVVGSKTKQVPLIKVKVIVMGNNGASNLNSISFRMNSGSQSYFNSNGFRLYHTLSDVFKNIESSTSTQVGSAVSISGNVVQFSGLNHKLEIGANYLWLTADIADDAAHGSLFSFGVDANSMSYNDTLLPATAHSSIVTTTISESVFYDNFDEITGWDLEGDYEIAVPEGFIIGGKSKDPSYAYSNTRVLGTDLTDDGAYPDTIYGPNAYHATSPLINLKYYNNAKVYMRKWIDFNPLDRASIDFSANGGKSWTTVWQSHIDNPTASTEWEELLFSTLADQYLSRQDSVQIRFSVNETNTIYTRAGFNIDNFTIVGNHLDTDVGITQIITPYNDCIGFGNDTVRVIVKNYAENPTPAQIPVYFGLWGPDSTIVNETIMSSIAKDDSIVYTFSTLANFPRGDIYNHFFVGVDLDGDEDPTNDTLTKVLYIQDAYVPPVTIDFEYKGGVWLPDTGSTWECKVPDGSIPVLPESPYSWILSPYGNYQNSDTSYITSNCFDLTFDRRHILELDYWLISEEDKDGAAIEFSTNDGETWELIEPTIYGPAWGWYTNIVDALGHEGWSGNSNGWTTAKELLPESLSTEVKVRFRVKWAADEDNNARGLAFDNVKVFPAPDDVGVSAIAIPDDGCQYSYPDEISLWVKNYGYNDLKTNDTMIIGYDFESEPAVIDTFLLSTDVIPGDSVLFMIPTVFDVTSPGTYQIRAYTLIEDDPWFYGSNNDTAWKSFEIWQNPITGLVDTISSRLVDTVVIRPIVEPEYTFLWHDNSTNPTFDVEVPGTVYLTVTETNHGCQTFDSVYIELLFNDVGIDSIIWPQSSCELSSNEHIQVQIRNFGTDSLIVDDKIYLFYEFNSQPVVIDSLILDAPLYSGSRRWFTFENTDEDFSNIGDYSIKAYLDYGGDTIPENDTILRNITVFGYPELDIGNDTSIIGLSYLIEVDPSFESYLWSDGDTNSTRVIDVSGQYWLEVYDHNGCPAYDTINIWFKIRDIEPYVLLSPTSSCDRSGPDPVILQIRNNGTDTIGSSDTIHISYKLNAQTRVSDDLTISQLLPGQNYNHTFVPQVDLTSVGSYTFELTAVMPYDLRPENDTMFHEVLTDVNPVIDLGVEDGEIYYMTEMVLDAGYDPNWIYLWQDGSTNQTFTVTDIMTVRVLVTDTTTGCFGGDTAFVYLDILDYMVTAIGLNATSCSGEYEDVPVTILNNGNLPRQGAEITLEYFMGSVPMFTEYFENVGTWQQGTSRFHTTQNTINLNDVGSEVIEVLITTTGDLRPENDDYNKNLQVIQSPEVDFGGSTLEVEFPYTLDAGSGYASYLWSNGSTGSTYTATEPGTYSVTVTGNNGCVTVRSVYLTTGLFVSELAEKTMQVDIYPNPANNYITVEASFDYPGKYILEIFNGQNSLFIMREIYDTKYKEEFFIGDLPPGLYYIRIRNDVMYHVSKMVIQ